MTQSMMDIRMVQLMIASEDFAKSLGAESAGVKLNLEGPTCKTFTIKEAEHMHILLQDDLGFLVKDFECTETLCVYRKGNLIITFEVEA